MSIVSLYACRACPGQVPAIRTLYANWQQLLSAWNAVSTELLSNSQDPRDLILLARFPNEETAWAAAESAVHRLWYAQLARLTEVGPVVSQYEIV